MKIFVDILELSKLEAFRYLNLPILNSDFTFFKFQWMTAGRGIVHSEMPCGEPPGKGLQLWVNLKAKDKMTTPEYQEIDPSQIPVATQDKVTVKGII